MEDEHNVKLELGSSKSRNSMFAVLGSKQVLEAGIKSVWSVSASKIA